MRGLAFLQEGWVIANHILVSFHVAFISSVLSLPADEIFKGEVLKFIFVSAESLVSALFLYISFHVGIAVHELGHYATAARLNALNEGSQLAATRVSEKSPFRRALYTLRLFLLAPYGRATGIRREGLNFYPDAPYNLAVAAAGPRASRNLALAALPPAAALLAAGLVLDLTWAIYIGRLCLGIGVVALLDFLMADPGKYAEFKQRERRAQEKAATVTQVGRWWESVVEARHKMASGRIQSLHHPHLGPVTAPWQFRNCGMGGRHTEKEYPESNISMQEAMFLILGAQDYQEAQEMTVRLQNRLKEIIENEEGCRVMGIGLEGGLAPYIDRGPYPLPEVRLWAMMKRTIEECGYHPGKDVAIALDPALSELEIAYRKHHNVPESIGMYLFWRDKTLTVMDRDGVLDLYVQAIKKYDIPILSIEDGFSEDDHEGWQKLLETLGDRVWVIGDDLVTTNDRTIELAAAKGLINASLIKANQIGTLYETLLAMLVALGKGQELVVSHRSKSPNDDMEAQIALAVNSLGLKAGGGANTERLVKYHAVTELMQRGLDRPASSSRKATAHPIVRRLFAYEEPTNAGVPSVGATLELELPDQGVTLKFKGATPLGTSAGTGEAIHLVDSSIEGSEYRETIDRNRELFVETEPGVYAFGKEIKEQQVRSSGDEDVADLFDRTQRYEGKGCLTAVDNVSAIIAPVFEGSDISTLNLADIDRTLLSVEVRVARRREKLSEYASPDEYIHTMQRKQNLGMNAVLSVSLALARAVAHANGKDLYELLREEMFAIIERLAEEQHVEIQGTRVDDYVEALRRVNEIYESQGVALYQRLRDLTGIYRYVPMDADDTLGPKPAGEAAAVPMAQKGAGTVPEETRAETPASSAPKSQRPVAVPPVTEGREVAPTADRAIWSDSKYGDLDEASRRAIEALNPGFYTICKGKADLVTRHEFMREYVSVKRMVAREIKPFGIVNNRLFLADDAAYVPYFLGGTVVIFRAREDSSELLVSAPVRDGLVLTDGYIEDLAGFRGDPIDLEPELFELDARRADPLRVTRMRDIAEQIQRVAKSVSRNDSVYILRILVAHLSLFSFKKYLNAKNLQPEVHHLTTELVAFLNTPLATRLPFLTRILVRNLTSVLTRPKLIDRLWNDTVDLSEVHVRGSDIANEIRRSTHHAVGNRTLLLVEGYLDYLNTGNVRNLAQLGYSAPGPADERARESEQARTIVARILRDLEELLGSSEVVRRIREWKDAYAAALIRSEYDRSLVEEMQTAIEAGLKKRERFTFYHQVRAIRNRMAQYPILAETDTLRRLQGLLDLKPDESDSDIEAAEHELRSCVDHCVELLQSRYQDELFRSLEAFMTAFEKSAYFETFKSVVELRRSLRGMLCERAFPEQRLLLYELDCLLEEMGYVSLRHIASQYQDQEVDLPRCFRIIHDCVANLTHDGIYSRQFQDLAGMLLDDSRTYAEQSNVLEQIQRNFQHILRRVIAPFEAMRERLGLEEDDLRISLANIQRSLHDLNSVASFADIARHFIENKIGNPHEKVIGQAVDPESSAPASDIVHLSHQEEIDSLVRDTHPKRNLRACYGGKGSGLIYISHLNIPVPDGFILPTTLGHRCEEPGGREWLDEMVHEHLAILEADVSERDGVDRKVGGEAHPLILAVRGGSAFSMPGMLSTVLFAGLNDRIVETLALEDPWNAYDSYRRFLASFAQAVWGIDTEPFDLVDNIKSRYGVSYKDQLPWEAMKEVAESTKEILRREGHGDELDRILDEPRRQITVAARAVFASWNSGSATRYRILKGLCDSWHTAVIVQEMSFGNRSNPPITIGMNETKASLTGVIPRTEITGFGTRDLLGEFKFSAAGQDLVGGLTSPVSFRRLEELSHLMPMLNRRLRHIIAKLRRFMGTDQEIEFTVDRGALSVLQSRASEIGANQINVNFVDPGPEAAHGIGVRGGAFRGLAAFGDSDFEELNRLDLSQRDDVDGVLMIMENPSPQDIPTVLSAHALLSSKGGSTSHAAVAVNGVRARDYHAVVGAYQLRVDARAGLAVVLDDEGKESATIRKGDVISIHGSTGAVYLGSREVAKADAAALAP